MKIKQIIDTLENISSFSLQEKWDNSFLNMGSMNNTIKDIYLSLDIDIELLEKVQENSLIITHHPLFISPLKEINTDIYPSKLIQIMMRKNISHISMHTNFDKTHLNAYVFEHILGFKIQRQDDFIIYGSIDMSLDELYKYVQNKLNLKYKKIVQAKNEIKTIALTTGSGGSLIGQVQADCFLTGDIKYHDAMMAKINNLSLIDIGHYESEVFFCEILKKELKKNDINAKIEQSQNPFVYQ